MIPLFALAVAAHADDTAAPVVLGWDWTQPHRWYLENDVNLPLYMWLKTPFNHEARITAFHVRLVAQCAPGEHASGKVFEVACTLEDVGLSAAPVEQDEQLLQPIVTELDQLLTGAVADLQVRPDGRLLDLGLEGIDRRNQRGGEVIEILRLVVLRAFAGLDLQTSKHGEPAWLENTPRLVTVPDSSGSAGLVQITHKVASNDGRMVKLVSGGQGVLSVGEGANRYDTRMVSEATWDLKRMQMVSRSWTVVALPTAGSLIATGGAGYPYLQQGRVVSLGDGQGWDVGESTVITPEEANQTAIQMQQSLGATPSP